MPTQDSSGRTVTDIEAALGRVIYRAGNFEVIMQSVGAVLATTGEERAMIEGRTAGVLLDGMKDLATRRAQNGELDSDLLGQLKAITADAQTHLDCRNDYVHGAWAEVDGELIAMNFRRKGEIRTRPLAVAELDGLAQELSVVCDALLEWLYDLLNRRHPDRFPYEPE